MFSRDKNAQIIHVTHDGNSASTCCAQTYIDNKGILDDLDVKASDLLQANSIIWVEGSSDRLYINRWIELISNGEISEGTHYQCMFYGGRLLSHLSSLNPDDENSSAISILRLNRNAIIVMDSDKKQKTSKINTTKQRIKYEISSMGGEAWVTWGKEIENYIPKRILETYLHTTNLSELKQYQDICEYLEAIKPGEGKSYEASKVNFATAITPLFEIDDISNNPPLLKEIKKICVLIREWNSKPEK